MQLDAISDKALILNLETAVQAERKCLTEVLHLLKEVERRRLFSSLGYKSLFEFAVKKLGYAEDQAYRRISAMSFVWMTGRQYKSKRRSGFEATSRTFNLVFACWLTHSGKFEVAYPQPNARSF